MYPLKCSVTIKTARFNSREKGYFYLWKRKSKNHILSETKSYSLHCQNHIISNKYLECSDVFYAYFCKNLKFYVKIMWNISHFSCRYLCFNSLICKVQVILRFTLFSIFCWQSTGFILEINAPVISANPSLNSL